MIRLILINLFLAGLYLWACEDNRIICLCLWFIVPFVNLILWGIIEAKQEKETF